MIPLNVLSRSKGHRNLAGCLLYYDLNEPLPDHSSLTRIRERYGVDVFRRFFDAIVEQCQQEKLVWGKELYLDSTQVNANADLDSLTPRFAVEARAAMQAHLAALFDEEDAEIEQQEASADRADTPQTDATSPVAISQVHGLYKRTADFKVSTTDPDATPMRLKGGGTHLGYQMHYVVDGGKARVILQVLVTPSEVMDNQPMLDLLWRVRFRW